MSTYGSSAASGSAARYMRYTRRPMAVKCSIHADTLVISMALSAETGHASGLPCSSNTDNFFALDSNGGTLMMRLFFALSTRNVGLANNGTRSAPVSALLSSVTVVTLIMSIGGSALRPRFTCSSTAPSLAAPSFESFASFFNAFLNMRPMTRGALGAIRR